MTDTIKTRLEAHAAACREALAAGRARPDVSHDLAAQLSYAYLDGANLASANLAGAYLGGANLAGANLGGARLASAYLDGARLGRWTLAPGEARTISGSRYEVLTLPTTEGRILRYGCETRSLADWRENVAALCKQHEPDRAAYYESEIRALILWCEALDAPKETSK